MQDFRSHKRAYADEWHGIDRLPGHNPASKKAKKEEQNKFLVGGMRNPKKAVDKLGVLREAGQDVARCWRKFTHKFPSALDAAKACGSERCELDPVVLEAWEQRLGTLIKVEPESSVSLSGRFQFRSPLASRFWKAWQKFARDPDEHLHVWAVHGAPLGMGAPIPPSNGVFPPVDASGADEMEAPELQAQLGTVNYKSMTQDPEAARGELEKLAQKGFIVFTPKKDIASEFNRGTVSRFGPHHEGEGGRGYETPHHHRHAQVRRQ